MPQKRGKKGARAGSKGFGGTGAFASPGKNRYSGKKKKSLGYADGKRVKIPKGLR